MTLILEWTVSTYRETVADGRLGPAPCGGPVTLIRILFGVINAVLRSATSSLLLLVSMMLSAAGILVLVGFIGVGLTGVFGLRLSRRRASQKSEHR